MAETLIQDIPSIRARLEDVKNFTALKNAMPFLRPFLRLFGVEVEKIDDAFVGFDELVSMTHELATIPDRFDDLFAERGWIIYDLMSFDVAKEAVKRGESGDLDGAEADLVAYYSVDTVRQKLQCMIAVKAFHPRMRLAQKAFEDYCAERYHACIPVVLALLDGLVNELHSPKQGFFAKDVDLEAWDSIAAHSKGLSALAAIFRKGRPNTNTEPITIPYRHGIMHGSDLGYDNRTVAAKAWAALFATRDWAIKAERGQLNAPPESPKKTWGDILRGLADLEAEKKLLEQWQPRELVPGKDVPTTGEPELFASGTPEHKLAEFLSYWGVRNYGYMARCVSLDPGVSVQAAPALVREVYDRKSLKHFEFMAMEDCTPAITEIRTKLSYEAAGQDVDRVVSFRMIYQDTQGNPVVRGKSGCGWLVLHWRIA